MCILLELHVIDHYKHVNQGTQQAGQGGRIRVWLQNGPGNAIPTVTRGSADNVKGSWSALTGEGQSLKAAEVLKVGQRLTF